MQTTSKEVICFFPSRESGITLGERRFENVLIQRCSMKNISFQSIFSLLASLEHGFEHVWVESQPTSTF